MKLKIITPDRVVVDETVDAVYGQAIDGSFGVLPKHIPMVTPLEVSLVEYVKSGQRHKATVMGGILRTDGDEVVVLSDAAEKSDEIDKLRAEQSRQRAEARLRERDASIDALRAEMALKRALLRLKATSY
jgi:F-type H+-transporting ATPase subunit epsilon